MAPLRLIVCGASGRMGARICDLARSDGRFTVEGRIVRRNSGEFSSALKDADAVIDFSAPEASVRFAQAAASKPLVIGTTGFSPDQTKKIAAFSKRTPILLSPNMSPAVNLMFHLARLSAKALKDFDAGVAETHHRHKKDSPSGTALRLARAVAEGRGNGEDVPIAAQRLGEVVGEHTVTFAGDLERLELTHRAQSRDVFARGALDAALWLSKRKPGLYDMLDLMGLR